MSLNLGFSREAAGRVNYDALSNAIFCETLQSGRLTAIEVLVGEGRASLSRCPDLILVLEAALHNYFHVAQQVLLESRLDRSVDDILGEAHLAQATAHVHLEMGATADGLPGHEPLQHDRVRQQL